MNIKKKSLKIKDRQIKDIILTVTLKHLLNLQDNYPLNEL
ncbi:hypothetical protein EDC37_106150 [Pectinatus cerevisiiphilus]|uniref:Uncharacterized protein n=1 Tax=Pectinatus cerevisiiphilus TaxID=86956 RepID=A0A4R3KA07_9FIRM|nr:hypothetical protein EDC37_106150 [Pectinatus cerevisiiphilus]